MNKFVNKIKWHLKQLLPLTYISKYKEGNKKILVIWKMWFGKCYQIKSYQLI